MPEFKLTYEASGTDCEIIMAIDYDDDGEVETTFKIAEKGSTDKANNNNKNTPTTPKTDDTSNMPVWIVGLTISGILLVLVLGCKVKGIRRKSHY